MVTQNTLRRTAQTQRQRLELAGIGMVQATLEREPGRGVWSDSTTTLDASIDETLAHLAYRTRCRFTVELDYPWSRDDGKAGALLGILPDWFDARCPSSECWPEADAA